MCMANEPGGVYIDEVICLWLVPKHVICQTRPLRAIITPGCRLQTTRGKWLAKAVKPRQDCLC